MGVGTYRGLALRGSLVISLGCRQGICSDQLKTFDHQFKIYCWAKRWNRKACFPKRPRPPNKLVVVVVVVEAILTGVQYRYIH